MGELECRADGDPPVVSGARLVPLAAPQPELAGGADDGRRRLLICNRLRPRRVDRGCRAHVQDRPPRLGRSLVYVLRATNRSQPGAATYETHRRGLGGATPAPRGKWPARRGGRGLPRAAG